MPIFGLIPDAIDDVLLGRSGWRTVSTVTGAVMVFYGAKLGLAKAGAAVTKEAVIAKVAETTVYERARNTVLKAERLGRKAKAMTAKASRLTGAAKARYLALAQQYADELAKIAADLTTAKAAVLAYETKYPMWNAVTKIGRGTGVTQVAHWVSSAFKNLASRPGLLGHLGELALGLGGLSVAALSMPFGLVLGVLGIGIMMSGDTEDE